MRSLTDPATLSAVSGLLLALVQLLRVLAAASSSPPPMPSDGRDTPPQTAPAAPAVPDPVRTP